MLLQKTSNSKGERPGDAEAEQSATKPGTAAYYDAHRHDELYAGAQLTVEQMCYLMLSQKQTHRQHDTAFDEQCRLHRDVLLPKPNKMPGSLYLMRKVRKGLLTLLELRAPHLQPAYPGVSPCTPRGSQGACGKGH